MKAKKISVLSILTAVSLLVSAVFFLSLYRFDNKYNTTAFSTQEYLRFEENAFGSSDVVWLVDGWEFYPGVTAGPEELSAYTPESVYIGQYSSFSSFNQDGSPFGSGTYRLVLHAEKGTYAFYLPEIFSACQIYINGEKTAVSGSFSPYRSLVKDLIFTVEADSTIELVVTAMNYSHYYSGMIYPPAVGTVESITRLINSRMLFYGFLCFTSLALALFSSAVWTGLRKNGRAPQDLWLGLLALSFSARVCYPFFHLFGLPAAQIWYTLEDAMSALGIFCIVRITCLVCHTDHKLLYRILTGISLGFVLLSVMNNLLFLTYLPRFVPIYGHILFWYRLAVSLLLTVTVLIHIAEGKRNEPGFLLGGIIIYTVSLFFHGICLGRFEPARFGWFDEWGTYVLILCFSIQMVRRSSATVRENQYLNKHLQEEVDKKTADLEKLLEQRRQLLSAFAHDIKTPMTSITTFTRLVELDNTDLDAETRQYLDTIRRKTGEMQDRLAILQDYFRQDTSSCDFRKTDLCRLIRNFCETNAPDMEVMGIRLESSLPRTGPVFINGNPDRLMSVLQNLVYNAAGFVAENGFIRLTLFTDGPDAVLQVHDNGRGISPENLAHVFDRFFTRRDDDSGSGLGLYIVRAAVEEHGGEITVESAVGEGTCFEIRLPLYFPT